MKRYIKILSVILVVIMSMQILNPGVAAAMEYRAATQLTVEKSASKGKLIGGEEGIGDLTEAEVNAAATDETETKGSPNYEVTPIVSEVTELRTENTKHYRHADGSYTMVTYPEPVHYQDEKGEWQEIDNTLKLNASANSLANKATYTLAASPYDISIPQNFSDNGQITATKDGYTIGLGIKSAKLAVSGSKQINQITNVSAAKAEVSNDIAGDEAASKDLSKLSSTEKIAVENSKKMELHNQTSSVTYKNIFSNADVEYVVSSSKIKENIVIKEKQEQYAYIFSISLGGLIPVKQDDGSIYLMKNADDTEPLFVLEAPYMFDANDEISTAVDMSIKNDVLTVTADADWINDEQREFPVVIDPTITLSNNVFKDAYISTASKNMNYNTGLYNYVGTGNLGTRRTYMQFSLPELPDGSVITNATLAIQQYTPDFGGASDKIYAFDLTGKASWDPKKITWNNQPFSTTVNGPQDTGTRIIDYSAYQTERKAYYTFNITSAAKKWYENGTNNGIMLAVQDENKKCHVSLYSSRSTFDKNHPIFTVSYLNNIGLEDYWSYETVDTGRSGTVYVNDYNGSMTYVHSVLSMTGNRLPISISQIYNSNNESSCNSSYYSGMNVGTNFHLNLQEVLTAISSSDSLYGSGYRYIYYDGDGTRNYFKTNTVNGTTKITHEYDTSMVITTEGSNTVITDSQGNKKYFRSDGKLEKISDANGNTQTLTFSGNKITAVTDPAGRKATLSYNADNQLASITDPAGRTTSFTYSSGKLSKITYSDGKTTEIAYSSDSISRVTSVDKSYITLSYSSTYGCGNRVGYVYQYDKGGNQIDFLKFQYTETNASGTSVGNTLVVNKNGKSNRYLFDAYGHATEIINEAAQTQYAVYGSDVNNSNTFNNVLDVSELQTISTNLINNHGFERTDYWTSLQSASNGGYGYSTEESSNGARSMKLELSNNTETVEVDQDFGATPTGTYTVSADVCIPEELAATENSGAFFGFTYCAGGVWHTDASQWILSTAGWERFSHTITMPNEAISSCHVFIGLAHTVGEVYFDNIQVEQSGGSRYYNLVENSNFSNAPTATAVPSGAPAYAWTNGSLQSKDGVQAVVGGSYFYMTGSPNNQKKISQSVPVNASAGETLIIGGKAAAYASIDNANARKFAIIADIYSTETTKVKTIEIPFDRAIHMDHQMKATYFKLTTPCDHVVFSFVYYNQVGAAAFDNAFIYVGNYGEHYSYNTNGQLTEVSNDEGTSTDYSYKNNDVVGVAQTVSGNKQTVAEVEYDANHNAKKVTNNVGTEIDLEYVNGQVSTQTVTETDENSQTTSSTEKYTYIQGGNYVKTYTDANGNVTTYTYDNNDLALIGLVETITDPNGNVTRYTYDPNTDEVLSVSGNAASDSSSVVNYTMQDSLPKTITRNGTTYSYDYDNQNRVTASKVGNQTLVSNAYDSRQRLSQQKYANGDVYTPVYDGRDRLTGETWNGIQTAAYYYNENDRLSQIVDYVANKTIQYDYAFYGLPFRILESDGSKTLYDYDMSGQLSHYTFSQNDEVIYDARFTNNEKGKPDDVIIKTLDNTLMHYNYDGLGRLTGYSCGPVITSVGYDADTGNASDSVKTYSLTDFDGNTLRQYEYSYDENGNIVKIVDDLTGETTSFTYDGLNRLVSETSGNDTFTYSYDDGGNPVSVSKNNEIVHSYDYGNTNWKDQLTAIDGKAITYDKNGNPLTYGGYTYTWQRGNMLAGIANGDNSISYAYDSQGHRIGKTVNGKTTNYIYSGDVLMRQNDGTNTLDFAYNSLGEAVGFVYNGDSYFYLKNQLGDVIGVADSSGALVAEYSYDAFGNTVSATGAMANINPLRYRGYYYDAESGLYYLASRYYNPEWRRFLNADNSFISGNDVINGSNMYAYNCDNPTAYIDSGNSVSDEQSQISNSGISLTSLQVNTVSNTTLTESQKRSKTLGQLIMTPIANIFTKDIAWIVGIIMGSKYSDVQNWQNRKYDGSFHLRSLFPKMSVLAGIGAAFLDFHKVNEFTSRNDGNYTTLRGSYQWQKSVGYNWWYDWFFSLGGPMDTKRFPFGANNMDYIIWCWKGDYWNLGAGAEIGIYYTDNSIMANNGYYETDPENLQLHVCMNVKYKTDDITYNFEQTNWWVTSFTPKIQKPNTNQIHVNLKVGFAEKGIHYGLLPAFKKEAGYHDKWKEPLLSFNTTNGYQFEINY